MTKGTKRTFSTGSTTNFRMRTRFCLNFGYTRSWFQNPNSFDQQFHNVNGAGVLTDPLTGTPLGLTDQVSQIKTYNIAPTWTHLIGSSTVFAFGGYVRRDQYNYYPSANPFNDLSPDLQSETVTQNRKLTNAGLRSTLSYVKGIHNMKLGGVIPADVSHGK